MAETLDVRIEDLPPLERGRILLDWAQRRLIVEKESEIERLDSEPESFVNQPKKVFREILQDQLDRIQRSPNVVYQRRGNWEYLKGSALGFGDIDVNRQYPSSESSLEWELFGPFAKRRCKIAAEIVSEVGFEALGKGIRPRPKWGERYTDSCDLPPRLEVAPEDYQRRVADEMQDELAMKAAEVSDDDHGALDRLSEKFDAVSLSLGLSYDSRQGAQELKGILDGKLLEINVYCSSIGSGNRDYIGSWGEKNMEEQQTLDIWSTYITVVTERQQRASNIWENEKYILQELGVV